jgi:hypothetical protein
VSFLWRAGSKRVGVAPEAALLAATGSGLAVEQRTFRYVCIP